jgi:hypothetical protein
MPDTRLFDDVPILRELRDDLAAAYAARESSEGRPVRPPRGRRRRRFAALAAAAAGAPSRPPGVLFEVRGRPVACATRGCLIASPRRAGVSRVRYLRRR